MGEERRGGGRHCRVVRRHDARGGDGSRATTGQGLPRPCRLRAARLLPASLCVAQPHWREPGAAAVFLGRQQERLIVTTSTQLIFRNSSAVSVSAGKNDSIASS